jgi:TolB protein
MEIETSHAHARTKFGLIVALVITVVAIGGLLGARASGFIGRGSAASSRLVVVSADGSLRTSDSRGGAGTKYAVDGFTFGFPAWSPDGHRIAAIAHGSEGDGVFVFEGPGRPPTRVYQDAGHPPFYLYWTPDGRGLGFLTSEPDGLAVRVAAADASAPASVVHHGSPLYWTFTESGRLLVHSGADQPGAFLGEVGVDGAVLATNANVPGAFRAPSISADGRDRAFVTPGDTGAGQIVVETRNGDRLQAADAFGPTAFEFDPGGSTRLAFIAADQPGLPPTPIPVGSLRLLGASSGASRVLLEGSVIAFFWSPDGDTIATLAIDDGSTNSTARAGVAELAIARSPEQSGETPPGASDFPVRLGFVDVASGAHRDAGRVYLSEVFATQLIPYFDQYALSHRLWSPDGRSFALPAVDDAGTSQIMLFDPDGSPARTVGVGVIAFWSPR